MNVVNSLIGIPFKNKNLAEFLTKQWLRSDEKLKFFIEKDKFSTIYKVRKDEDLLFHIIVKQLEEIEKPQEINSQEDMQKLIASEKCSLSVFIFKGREEEFKYYAYSLLQTIINYSDQDGN